MTAITSFSPIEGESARVLILGSIPGVASLSAGQYYAHPQNAFWKIMGRILDIAPAANYETRVEALKRANIALWDVLESCIRPGSMDTAIDLNSAKPNNIAALLQRQPQLHTICFNGSAAEKIFKQRIQPFLGNVSVKYIRLPSTSPAHASMSFEIKLAAWKNALHGHINLP